MMPDRGGRNFRGGRLGAQTIEELSVKKATGGEGRKIKSFDVFKQGRHPVTPERTLISLEASSSPEQNEGAAYCNNLGSRLLLLSGIRELSLQWVLNIITLIYATKH
jgi:hypothetical protein